MSRFVWEPGDLVISTGITTVREARVCYRGRRKRIAEPLKAPADVARFVRWAIENDAREHFVAILLDGRHRPIAWQVVSIGTATSSLVHPREVFQLAVGLGACAVILAHNHPSGDPTPSSEDRDVTARLVKAGNVLGIRLLDHVVVAEGGYHSLREENAELFEAVDA